MVRACDIFPSRWIHTAVSTQAKTGLQCESTESDDTVCTSQCSVPTVCLPPPRGVTWEKFMNIQCVYNFLRREGLLTFGAHAQRGLQYLVCVFVCLSVDAYSCTTGYKAAYELYKRVQIYEGLKIKKAILLKRLRSGDMA